MACSAFFINYNLDWFDCFENWFSIEIFFILCTGKIILKLKNFRAEFVVIESRLHSITSIFSIQHNRGNLGDFFVFTDFLADSSVLVYGDKLDG